MKRIKALTLSSTLLIAASVFADDDYFPPVNHEPTKTECSACHLAYSPRLLPKESWVSIMGDLENHFGEDARLDEATRVLITDYLVANAGRSRGNATHPPLRITELSWFKHEHGRRLRARAEASPTIVTISNCTGCHSGAERGYFEDD